MRRGRNILVLLIVLIVALLSTTANPFFYPTFYRLTKRLHSFLGRRSKDMTRLNAIDGTELSQLNALYSALDVIVRGANWPKYQGR